ncbi:hypothetical protein H5410_031497 [Solanum commersonii]|uniref:RNase H type-1 domain-containing protein n=1 Tax=Solanum commersonii TaxID=4109 RepID=A0A9J5YK40_SOLCO|nr:hypothetical protein H5410_031497 [Solanum commersonii]
MRRWWTPEGSFRIQVVYHSVPIIILWCLWKRMDTILHRGSFLERKVIWDINDIILKVIRTRFKRDIRRNDWTDITTELQRHINTCIISVVRWIPYPINGVKCNTNRAFRGYSRPNSATFCIRDHAGRLVVAKCFKIQDTTNLVAESKAIREELLFCKKIFIAYQY